jgi:hypothetical protein
MKHTISLSLLSFFFIGLFISCTKDETAPSISSSQVRKESPIHLTAMVWAPDQSGRFVCQFTDFMRSSGDANAVSIATVYLLTGDSEIMISYSPITYMSGQLWSEQEGKDLKVYYQPFVAQSVIPFEKLDIKVERQ